VNHPNDLTALLKPGIYEWSIYEMGNKRVRGDEDVGSRYKNWEEAIREPLKEHAQTIFFHRPKDCEAWQRPPLAPIERRRDSPYPPPSAAHFFQLNMAVFHKPIRWISYNRVNRTLLRLIKPLECIPMDQRILSQTRRELP
jgi:hypothetical protein